MTMRVLIASIAIIYTSMTSASADTLVLLRLAEAFAPAPTHTAT